MPRSAVPGDHARGCAAGEGDCPGDHTPRPGPARPTPTFFEAAGGEDTFRRLVAAFYEGVAGDPALRRLYPEEDLTGAEERLRLFLIEYWGGPTDYTDRRGHPRLRMRHVPYAIGPAERDAWLAHMRAAIDTVGLPPHLAEPLWDYLLRAAHALQNRAG